MRKPLEGHFVECTLLLAFSIKTPQKKAFVAQGSFALLSMLLAFIYIRSFVSMENF